MASKRDLVEAHGYTKRRLVSAFVSGAPAGRDVESVSRVRPVIAGLAASALLLGGTAIAGMLAAPLAPGWEDAHVIIGKQSAARYVSEKGTLYPVLNATSARLMLPSTAGYPIVVVDDNLLGDIPRGAARGILGAPDDLPTTPNLLQTGWVSCLVSGRTVTTLRSTAVPAAPDTDAPIGQFVTSGGSTWLIAGDYRYPVPADKVGALRRDLHLDGIDVPDVPGVWLDVVNLGRPLTLAVAGQGTPLPPAMTMGGKITRVGQVIKDASNAGALSLVLASGTVPLTEFAAAVYRSTSSPELAEAVTVKSADIATVPAGPSRATVYPDSWPERLPTAAKGTVCVLLQTQGPDKPARTRVIVLAAESPRVTASAGATVEPGKGALVRASSTGSPLGPVFIIDQSGRKFAITDPSDETLARLGYAGLRPAIVPAPWLLVFPSGPALSEQAALAAPTAGGGGP